MNRPSKVKQSRASSIFAKPAIGEPSWSVVAAPSRTRQTCLTSRPGLVKRNQ